MIVSRKTLYEAVMSSPPDASASEVLRQVAERYGMTPEDVAAAIQPITEDEACPQS